MTFFGENVCFSVETIAFQQIRKIIHVTESCIESFLFTNVINELNRLIAASFSSVNIHLRHSHF